MPTTCAVLWFYPVHNEDELKLYALIFKGVVTLNFKTFTVVWTTVSISDNCKVGPVIEHFWRSDTKRFESSCPNRAGQECWNYREDVAARFPKVPIKELLKNSVLLHEHSTRFFLCMPTGTSQANNAIYKGTHFALAATAGIRWRGQGTLVLQSQMPRKLTMVTLFAHIWLWSGSPYFF